MSNDAMTRREALRRGALGVAAVGGAAFLSGPALAAKKATIRFYGWQTEDLPKTMKAWNKAHGVTVKPAFVDSSSDYIPKYAVGNPGFDLVDYTAAQTPTFLAAGNILQPLERDRIPNLRNLRPYFRDAKRLQWSDEKGRLIGVPYYFSTSGVQYDSAKTAKPTSWFDLLDKKFEGKVAFVDDSLTVLISAARALGYRSDRLTPAQVERMRDFLTKLAKQAKGISPSYGDAASLVASGEAHVIFPGWTAVTLFAQAQGVKTLTTNVRPKEGAASWVELYTIPKGANEDVVPTVYAWINEVLRPRTNGLACSEMVAGTTVAGAERYLDAATRALYPYRDFDQFIEQAPVMNMCPVKSSKYLTFDGWQQLFTKIKITR